MISLLDFHFSGDLMENQCDFKPMINFSTSVDSTGNHSELVDTAPHHLGPMLEPQSGTHNGAFCTVISETH